VARVDGLAVDEPRRAVSALARGVIDGQEVFVEVYVALEPGEDSAQKRRDVINRAYPQMELIESAEFSLTGLVFDQFSDGNPGNDFVNVQYNPAGAPSVLPANHRQVWLDSQATWTNVESASFVFADGGDTDRCPSLVQECRGPQKFDGYNDVGWGNISDPSVLGVTWYGTQNDEFDMWLDNNNFSWYIGDPGAIPSGWFDTETVWLHEFGHGLGLGHSSVNGAVMEPYYEGVRRALHQDDIAGIVSLYPSPGPTPLPSPTPTPTSTPTPTPEPSPSPTPIPGDSLSVTSIGYEFYGGKNSNRHLRVIVTVEDNLGLAVAGAGVSIELSNGSQTWVGTGQTATNGTVTFSLKNAPGGCYSTVITNVILGGYTWDRSTPSNSSCN